MIAGIVIGFIIACGIGYLAYLESKDNDDDYPDWRNSNFQT